MRSRIKGFSRNGALFFRSSNRQYHSNGNYRHDSTKRIRDGLKTVAAIGAAGLYVHTLVSSNIKRPVLDDPILETDRDVTHLPAGGVKAIDDLHPLEGMTSGRTCGYRAYIDSGTHYDYYFYKETYDRKDLVKELLFGSLGNYLVADLFPQVFLVELPYKQGDKSQYAFLSENVGNDEDNDDLEEWALVLNDKNINDRVSPRHLGVAMAFAMLTGQSDCKLANLVVIRDKERTRLGSCYAIDFESCSNYPAAFLNTSLEAVNFVGEFRSKTYSELMLEQSADGLLDTADDIHKPLRDQHGLKQQILPLLLDAVQRDLEDGSVIWLYRKFAAMTEDDFVVLFDRFGSFITSDERNTFMQDMRYRQERTHEYLYEYDLQNDVIDTDDHNESFVARNKM